jgi:hypothetical protein
MCFEPITHWRLTSRPYFSFAFFAPLRLGVISCCPTLDTPIRDILVKIDYALDIALPAHLHCARR